MGDSLLGKIGVWRFTKMLGKQMSETVITVVIVDSKRFKINVAIYI